MEQQKEIAKPLTKLQRKILDFIHARAEREGMPPTHDEIAAEFGYRSSFNVRQHLSLIKKKGYLDIYPGKSRGIKVHVRPNDAHADFVEMPIVGRIAAGVPIFAEEQIEDRICVSRKLFPSGMLFVLRIEGNSMINVGINPGDLAIIRQQENINNGEIAAVLLNEAATLKRFYLRKNYVCLKAENEHFADIRIENNSDTQIRVLGLYVGLIRQVR
jgi:repressor LexA